MTKIVYEIMHENRRVAKIDETGFCKVYYKSFMPYNLYFEEEEDIDTLVNNVTNFNYWCATRVLTLDRTYAKEILNSIGMTQAVTDKERAKIALSYRCASLTDPFWVRKKGEKISFEEINLYDNHLDNTFIDIALKGKQYTVDNASLAKDLSTNGCFPKAWKRVGDGFVLLKDGGDEAVERELLASKICQCFDVDQVVYTEDVFDNVKVTRSENITSKEYSIVSMELFEIYWGNWGVLIKNANNKPVSLHKLMDFNQAFYSYDTLEGANCQTTFGEKMNQQEAAAVAVKRIGLNQICDVDRKYFEKLPQYYEMFTRRLEYLKSIKC